MHLHRLVAAVLSIPANFDARAVVLSLACCVSACHVLPENHTTRGGVDLALGGEAIGKFISKGTAPVHVAISNRGPGELQFTVNDDRGRTLESGALGVTERSFTWRPLESHVTFIVRAAKRPATFEYRVSSQSGIGVEWNLSNALSPKKP